MTKHTFFLLIAAACAVPALAQVAGAAPAAPGATAPSTPGPGPRDTMGANPSSGTAGSTTQQPGGTAPGAVPPISGTPGAIGTTPGTTAQSSTGSPNTSVQRQATDKLRLQLQQCQGLNGAAQNDCITRANQDFSRAVSNNEPLAQQGQGSIVGGNASAGMGGIGSTGGLTSSTATPPENNTPGGVAAGNTRSTPDLTPTPRDNTSR